MNYGIIIKSISTLIISCGMLRNLKLHLNYLSVTRLMKFWSLTFATQMIFWRSGSELFDTSKILFSSEYFHYKIFIHEKFLEN